MNQERVISMGVVVTQDGVIKVSVALCISFTRKQMNEFCSYLKIK